MSGLQMDEVRDAFAASTDRTVGIEEEFAICDPATLDLAQRFDELFAACQDEEVLRQAAAGELITSEIEIRSGRGEDFAHAIELQRTARRRLFALAAERDALLGSMGTHPWASYLDQQIIDTEHYHRVAEGLQYVARRNNTFGIHVHVGVRGANRAVAVCDALRRRLPILLAVSASSPFLDGRDTGLASVRTQTFTRSFPRCGVPPAFGDFAAYADFVEMLTQTNSIVEATQLWWSVRPHHRFGTVEMRICDAQAGAARTEAIEGLLAACVAQAALDYDEGRAVAVRSGAEIEENLWRAIRHGMTGSMIDFDARRELPARQTLEDLLVWCEPSCRALGLELGSLATDPTDAERARRLHAELCDLRAVWQTLLDETQASFPSADPASDGAGPASVTSPQRSAQGARG